MVKHMNKVKAFSQSYINGRFVTSHGTQVIDLVNPTNNEVIGKVTMADEVDTRNAIAAAKAAFKTFSQTSKAERMDYLQRLHESVSKRMDDLVQATVLEYGAPQDRAKGSNNLAANIFLHFKGVLQHFDLTTTVGTSKVEFEPVGVVGIFTPWNSSAGSIAIKLAPAIASGLRQAYCAGREAAIAVFSIGSEGERVSLNQSVWRAGRVERACDD
jgi:aldehyde dehydrogenase (NAD+)